MVHTVAGVFAIICLLFTFATCNNTGPFPEADFSPVLTNKFVVQVRENVHIPTLERRHNVTFIRSMITNKNFHIFEIPHAEHDPLFHLSPDILWFERQYKNKRFKRSDNFYSDPEYHSQWHLVDTNGQADLSVEGAWQMGFFGDGILVSIVDDGLEYRHPDIADNYFPDASYDVNNQDFDPTPSSWDIHGSQVGGTIAGIGNNGVCGVGVAPKASIAAIRMLAGDPGDYEEAESLQYRNDIVDIYTSSWGPYDDGQRLEGPGPLVMAAFEDSTSNGRNGMGSIFTWAAGNGKSSGDNCNYDGFANSRYTIAVGAVGRNGVSAYYSEPCAAMVVCAPSSDATNHITTSNGVSACTAGFGGTSAACPMVAGVVALCLQANPRLGWRDVQGVLIHSASITDHLDSDWKENGAGLHVNHKYGFGIVNATAAVSTALDWVNYRNYRTIDSGVLIEGKSIPDRGMGELRLSWHCDTRIVVEHVDIFFDAIHPHRGELQVTLTSPMGTQSVLADVHGDRNSDFNFWKFMTIRNWDESSFGTWTLTVSDHTTGHVGAVNFWNVVIYGHEGVPIDMSVSESTAIDLSTLVSLPIISDFSNDISSETSRIDFSNDISSETSRIDSSTDEY